jgi:tetratricopeptide (TPR) repeat protein
MPAKQDYREIWENGYTMKARIFSADYLPFPYPKNAGAMEMLKKMTQVPGLAFLLLTTIILCQGQSSPEGEKYFKTANDLLNKKEYKQAIEYYDLSLKYIPKGENIFYMRGRARHQLSDYPAAIADFTVAISLNKSVALFYNARAWTYCFSGAYSKAIEDADKAIGLEKNGDYYDTRATAYGLRLQFLSATADLNSAIKMNPKAMYYYKRGLMKKANNELSAAEQDFAQARKLDAAESFKVENDPFNTFFTEKYFSSKTNPQTTLSPATTGAQTATTYLLKEDRFSIPFPGKPEIRRESNKSFSKAITASYNAGTKLYYFAYRILEDSYLYEQAWGELLWDLRVMYAKSINAKVSDIVNVKEKTTYEGMESDMYKLFKPGFYGLYKDVGVMKDDYRIYRIGLVYADRFPTEEELN